jgi:hypothetical protein
MENNTTIHMYRWEWAASSTVEKLGSTKCGKFD